MPQIKYTLLILTTLLLFTSTCFAVENNKKYSLKLEIKLNQYKTIKCKNGSSSCRWDWNDSNGYPDISFSIINVENNGNKYGPILCTQDNHECIYTGIALKPGTYTIKVYDADALFNDIAGEMTFNTSELTPDLEKNISQGSLKLSLMPNIKLVLKKPPSINTLEESQYKGGVSEFYKEVPLIDTLGKSEFYKELPKGNLEKIKEYDELANLINQYFYYNPRAKTSIYNHKLPYPLSPIDFIYNDCLKNEGEEFKRRVGIASDIIFIINVKYELLDLYKNISEIRKSTIKVLGHLNQMYDKYNAKSFDPVDYNRILKNYNDLYEKYNQAVSTTKRLNESFSQRILLDIQPSLAKAQNYVRNSHKQDDKKVFSNINTAYSNIQKAYKSGNITLTFYKDIEYVVENTLLFIVKDAVSSANAELTNFQGVRYCLIYARPR